MKRFSQWRIYTLLILVILSGGTILFRLFSLQIFDYDFYNALAQDQYEFAQDLFPKRSEVYIQDLKSQKLIPLAINKEFNQVYAVPTIIDDDQKEELSEKLASLLQIDKEIISTRINKKDDPYEPLKHKVDDDVARQIKELEVDGIRMVLETSRLYPGSFLASHLIGFVGISDDQKIGQYGIEGYYENEMKGQLGSLVGEKDTAGRWIPTTNQEISPAQEGPTLVLTIDQNIQFKVEKELKAAMEKWQAQKGTIIVTDPDTGAIYAMASYPNFDPNNYSQVEDISVYLNPAIQSIYEPGSVIKAMTMAAGLDSGKVKTSSIFEDTGPTVLAGGVIRNVNDKIYGKVNMTEILEKSINTGSVYIQQETGKETFREYFQNFGFGQMTGIDLSGEVSGSLINLAEKRDIDYATVSFGQGISVTPIQLVNAFAVIANGGKLMQPHIVDRRIYPDDTEEIVEPKIIRQVISEETSNHLKKMLTAVIDSGHGQFAKVQGYSLAGKTGTAEVPKENEPGYSDETIHTFVGFGPSFDPKFVILIKLEKPVGVLWSATSVAPIFKTIAEYLLNYFEIPPS